MTRYERQVLTVDDGGGFDIEGNIVAVLHSPQGGKRTVTALVEIPETNSEATTPTTFTNNSDSSDKLTFFCGAEKSDGTPCERVIDNAKDNCWQHTEQ